MIVFFDIRKQYPSTAPGQWQTSGKKGLKAPWSPKTFIENINEQRDNLEKLIFSAVRITQTTPPPPQFLPRIYAILYSDGQP